MSDAAWQADLDLLESRMNHGSRNTTLYLLVSLFKEGKLALASREYECSFEKVDVQYRAIVERLLSEKPVFSKPA
jgi:hypothetical protein